MVSSNATHWDTRNKKEPRFLASLRGIARNRGSLSVQGSCPAHAQAAYGTQRPSWRHSYRRPLSAARRPLLMEYAYNLEHMFYSVYRSAGRARVNGWERRTSTRRRWWLSCLLGRAGSASVVGRQCFDHRAMTRFHRGHCVGLVGNLNTDLSLISMRASAVVDTIPKRPLNRVVEIDRTWSHKAALCLVKPPSPSSSGTWNGLDLRVPVMGTIMAIPLAPVLSLSSDTTTAGRGS